MKRWLLELLLGRATLNEILLCLQGAKYCMTHDVMGCTRDFELRHIEAAIKMIGPRR